MTILFCLIITLIMMLFAVTQGYFLGIPLSISLALFSFLLKKRGFSWSAILQMGINGSKRGSLVIQTFMLIGAITAGWLSSGTIAYLVSLAFKLLQPSFFLLSAFWLSSLVSLALGTSFGTCSTIGVVLMVLANSGQVNPYITAGAIISGIFLGDRASPMSSALYLLTSLTETEHYATVKMMLKTTIAPFLLASLAFGIISPSHPLHAYNTQLLSDMESTFHLSWPAIIPALLIFSLCIAKVAVKKAMSISIMAAWFIAFFYQGFTISQIFNHLIFGFYLPADHVLFAVFKGGGLLSMMQTSYIILIATAIAGLFDQGGLLDALRPFAAKAKSRIALYFNTLVVAFLSGAFGCNQAISIVMTTETMRPIYNSRGISSLELARDVSLTAFLIPALIPWNIASLVPLTTLGLSGISYLPYAFFLIIGVLYQPLRMYLNQKSISKY